MAQRSLLITAFILHLFDMGQNDLDLFFTGKILFLRKPIYGFRLSKNPPILAFFQPLYQLFHVRRVQQSRPRLKYLNTEKHCHQQPLAAMPDAQANARTASSSTLAVIATIPLLEKLLLLKVYL